LAVKINGNHGTHKEISVSTKVSKEIVPFQQEFPIIRLALMAIRLNRKSKVLPSMTNVTLMNLP